MRKSKFLYRCNSFLGIILVIFFSFVGLSVHAQNWLTAGNSGTNAGNFIGTSDNVSLRFRTNNSQVAILDSLGHMGIAVTAPAAFLNIGAGTATYAPLKLTSGTNLTTPVAGAIEYNGTNIYFSPSTTRKRFVLSNDATPSNGQIPIGNGTDYTVATITAGTDATVTNASGSITIGADTSTGGTKLATQGFVSRKYWGLTGTSGTTPGTNYIGTADNQDLIFKRNNVQSGLINTTSTSFGVNALISTTTGIYNTALGDGALKLNTSGYLNTGIGVNALGHDTSGYQNVAVGVNSLIANTTGYNNVSIGYEAGEDNLTGTFNVFLGEYAGQNITSGNQNIFVGPYVGSGITTGFGNTIIGQMPFGGSFPSTLSNTIILSDGNGNNRLYIDSSGHTGLGGFSPTSLPTATLEIKSGTSGVSGLKFTSLTNASTAVTTNPNATTLSLDSSGKVILVPGTVINAGTNTTVSGTGTTSSPYVISVPIATQNWGLTGNAAISGTNFIGTTNNSSLLVKTNDTTRMSVDSIGNVFVNNKLLIGSVDPSEVGQYALAVNGTAIFTKAKLKLYSQWPDYVFGDDYHLPGLDEVENYIKLNKHLSDMPSADDVKKQGIDIGDNQTVLVKKVEELTLYIIDQNNKVEEENRQIQELRDEVEELKQLITKSK
jgi:trimeric autotransporter adhesin